MTARRWGNTRAQRGPITPACPDSFAQPVRVTTLGEDDWIFMAGRKLCAIATPTLCLLDMTDWPTES